MRASTIPGPSRNRIDPRGAANAALRPIEEGGYRSFSPTRNKRPSERRTAARLARRDRRELGPWESDKSDRIPEIAVAKIGILRVRLSREHGFFFDQPDRLNALIRIARPGAVSLSVRIAGPGEIRPGRNELIGELRLRPVQRMRNAVRAAVPERE